MRKANEAGLPCIIFCDNLRIQLFRGGKRYGERSVQSEGQAVKDLGD